MASNTFKTDLGRVHVSDEAIAQIAASCALKVPGIAAMGSSSRVEGLAQLLWLQPEVTGVVVEIESEVRLRLFLIVELGAEIDELATQVQEAVSEAVEGMTGLEVRAVDLIIQGVRLAGEKKAA